MDEVKRLCNSVLMMKGGAIVDSGTPDHLITKHGRKDKAINLLKTKLVKRVSLITPNIPEAEILASRALGMVMNLPERDKHGHSIKYLKARLAAVMN